MKNYIKMVMIVFLSAISLKSEAEDLNRAMKVTSGGNIELESFKYILRNKKNIAMNTSYRIINQVIHFSAYMPSYMTHIKSSQIDGLILLDAKYVKPGLYINNGYDKYGRKTPLSDWKGIIYGFQYFCTSDSVAVAKTNCGNEQDYLAIVQQIVYTPPTPPPAPPPVVIPVAPPQEYKYNCLGRVDFTGGKERLSKGGDLVLGRFSAHGEFYFHYRDKSWWQRDPFTGLYDSLICPERKVANCNCPKEKPKPKTEQVEVVQKPYYYHTESKKWFFRIDLTPSYGGYQQQYQPQPRQRYYEEPRQQQPQQQQWGNYRPFDTGNQPTDRPFDTGNQPVDRSFDTGAQQQQIDRSFDIGNRNNSSNNDHSFDRGGYIDGVNERVR